MQGKEISRQDGRYELKDLNPAIAIKDSDLGISTEFELNDIGLEVRVEGLDYSYMPLIQANYSESDLSSLLINFNFPYIEDKVEDDNRGTNEDTLKKVINYLRTQDEIFNYFNDPFGGLNEEELKELKDSILLAKILTRIVLDSTYDEAEIENCFTLLTSSGFINNLGFEMWYDIKFGKLGRPLEHDDPVDILFEQLQDFEFNLTKESLGEDIGDSRIQMSGILLSDFTSDSYILEEVEGDGEEDIEGRTIESISDKSKKDYGKLNIKEQIIEVIRVNDENLVLNFRKSGKNLVVFVPIKIKYEEAKALIEGQSQNVDFIKNLVPFEIAVVKK